MPPLPYPIMDEWGRSRDNNPACSPAGNRSAIPWNKGLFRGAFLVHAGESQDNSWRYSAHPNGWMRRNWTVGPKPTKRSECVDFPTDHQTGD